MLLKPMRLEISEELVDEFKDRAKAAFPTETWAALLGKIEPDKITVDELWMPAGLSKYCHRSYVDIQGDWSTAAKRYAKKLGKVVLGDIHSHPYDLVELTARKPHRPDASPSEGDYDRQRDGLLQGICLVTETKTHQLRARIRFWGMTIPFVETVT